ncbi:MAG TPA: chemotaxis protein CheA [Spirochaetota bacterium]|nr:chemotaxis protein CheA [Spirochaetota bacterium]
MSDFIDESLLKDYFDEAYSQIDMIESNLLVLEKNTEDKEAIDSIFRAAHTLKGGSATVQMDEITKFTHLLEDAMDEVRSGKVKVDGFVVDTLLDALDIIKNMVRTRSDGSVYNVDYSKTVKSLQNIVNAETKSQPKESKKQQTDSVVETKKENQKSETKKETDDSFKISEYDMLEINESNPDNLPIYKILIVFDESNPMRTVGGIQVFTALRDIALVLKTYPEFDEIYSEVFHRDVVYIVASNASAQKLKEFATIPDTTVDVIVTPVDKDSVGIEPEKPKETGDSKKNIDNLAKSISEESISSLNKEIIQAQKDTVDDDKSIQEDVSQSKKNQIQQQQQSQKDQKVVASSVLRVESSRIDDLLNLVSEIVINKATFNQINSQFVDNLELLNFNLSDYKDRLRNFIERIPDIVTSLQEGKSFTQIKKEIQVDFATLTNQFDSFASSYKGVIDRFKSTTQNLDRISSSLQEGVMRVRMVQIKQIFSRFPRLVRDLSRDLKKEVDLVIEGEETEVDKAMIDDLIDPLIHIVRNAIDHGLEMPEDREKNKKNPIGKLKLSAFNEGNMITINVSEDGRGIDVEKIRKKAIEKGLIASDKSIKEQDAYSLIFEPGFSTAEKVTSVSGRGVGLDVVKKNIEKLSGTIRVTSELGKGTTFAIKLPLTLAIIQGLMIKVKEEIYAIPISSVLESIRIKPEDIKTIDNYEVINVRDDVLSLLRLNRMFKLGDDLQTDYYFVVLIGSGEKKIGLLVDSLIGEEDIVIKPLKDKYTNTPGIAGATILGDGTVSLILDVSQLIELGLKTEQEAHQTQKRGVKR